MNKDDIKRAVFAMAYTCRQSLHCKKLDGTIQVAGCFDYDCKKRNYNCDLSCEKARKFIDILKQPVPDIEFDELFSNKISINI